jgi:hypothetical protein
MKQIPAEFLLALVLPLAPACIIEDSASFTVANESDYVLFEVNLAPEDSFSWGRNLLRGDVLYPGEALTIDYIECDYYDARVVDDTNLECIIMGLDLCFSDSVWVIDNQALDNCAFLAP